MFKVERKYTHSEKWDDVTYKLLKHSSYNILESRNSIDAMSKLKNWLPKGWPSDDIDLVDVSPKEVQVHIGTEIRATYRIVFVGK